MTINENIPKVPDHGPVIPILSEDHEQMEKKSTEIKTLQYNIETLREIFVLRDYLSTLWKTNREQFLQELWQLTKKNLGSSFTKIIYRDLEFSQDNDETLKSKKDDRPKLIFSCLSGADAPKKKKGGKAEEELIKEIGKNGFPTFSLMEFLPEKEELTLMGSIQQGPLLIMAKTTQWTPLQLALFQALFHGLNEVRPSA